MLLDKLCDSDLDPVRRALLCQRAEHAYAQVPCGIMDQFICLMGRPDHVLLLDCQSRAPVWIPWTDPNVTILVVNTQVKHEHSGGEYSRRRESCETAAQRMGVSSLREAELDLLKTHAAEMDEMSRRCARHVIAENHRTRQAAVCIRDGDWVSFGNLMYDSHESLRSDYQVSCAELDLLINTARNIGLAGGVFGARMTGGGFGGCAVLLIDKSKQDQVMWQIEQEYRYGTGTVPTLFVSHPSAGAVSIEV